MSIKKRLSILILMNIFIFLCFESYSYLQRPIEKKYISAKPLELINLLANAPVAGREKDNQFLLHNVALFHGHPKKLDITRAYIGTSRSKMLRPSWYGAGANAINASGNSYNEITYGVLLQAELLRLEFPNLKEVFVESSLLMRRPDRLIIEDDHKKYFPLLNDNWYLRDEINYLTSIQLNKEEPVNGGFQSAFFETRQSYQIGNLINSYKGEPRLQIFARDIPFVRSLDENGERFDELSYKRELKDQLPAVSASNIKAQRLRDVESWYPWDGLFEVLALWGKEHHIQIIFYQPPVRSDLYIYQLENGIQKHEDDLVKISKKYNIPFINFNKPELGFQGEWSLFSDEDHLETCLGAAYYLSGLQVGYDNFKNNNILLSNISLGAVKEQSSSMVARHCVL